jgi:hypothetical protein
MFFSQISFEYFLSFKNFSPTAIFACAGAYSHYTIGVEKCKPFPLKLKYVNYGKLEGISWRNEKTPRPSAGGKGMGSWGFAPNPT